MAATDSSNLKSVNRRRRRGRYETESHVGGNRRGRCETESHVTLNRRRRAGRYETEAHVCEGNGEWRKCVVGFGESEPLDEERRWGCRSLDADSTAVILLAGNA